MAEGVETRVVVSDEIRDFLTKTYADRNLSHSLKCKLRIALSDQTEQHSILYDILSEAHQFYSIFKKPKDESDFIELHELVKSSRVFTENIPEPKRSTELIARLAKLKAEQEQKEYNRMVANVKKKRVTIGDDFGAVVRTTKQQIMTVINFIISIVAAFAFGYVSSQYAFSNDFGLRLIFSIVVASVVALAELFFMARFEI